MNPKLLLSLALLSASGLAEAFATNADLLCATSIAGLCLAIWLDHVNTENEIAARLAARTAKIAALPAVGATVTEKASGKTLHVVAHTSDYGVVVEILSGIAKGARFVTCAHNLSA